MLQKMKNVLIVGPRRDYQQIIDVLYQTGTIHLEDASQTLPPGSKVEKVEYAGADEMAGLLLKTGSLLQIFADYSLKQGISANIQSKITAMSDQELIGHASERCDMLNSVIHDIATRKAELTLYVTTLSRYKQILERISPLENEIPVLEGFEVTILVIQKEYEEVLEIIRPFLSEITRGQFEFIAADLDEKNLAVITVFSRKHSDKVHDFLYSKNVSEVKIPDKYANMPLEEACDGITRDSKTAIEEIKSIDGKIADYASVYEDELKIITHSLQDRLDEIQAYTKFARTDYTFIVKGWVPKKYLNRTIKSLKSAFGDRVVLTVREDKREDLETAPVFYDNPFWVKPFEFFMQLVRPPQYQEIDPTPIIAIFFPLFFGLIVGDIGYGLCILIFALIVRWKIKDLIWVRQMADILIISSIPTIIFGYLFGEFFGDFGEHQGWLEPLNLFGISWNRVEAIIPLLVLTIGIGIVHVFLGLFLGAYNAVIRRNRKHFCEKCGMIGVIVALLAIITAMIGILPALILQPAVAVILISLILLIYGGGALGAIEIMGTIGNIMSYARLMAIGLASVILAVVANRLGGEIEVLYLGVVIAILLHALNIILAMFSPSIHSLRLHVVEFFSKFYEGGGELYNPFGRDRM